VHNDEFYILEKTSLKKIKEILVWARKNALQTSVDELSYDELTRTSSSKTFEQVLKLVHKNIFFRIIQRDILEVCACVHIKNDDKEYFLFISLDKNKFEYLNKKYKLKKL
jgi:hypothetical protein